MTRRPVTPATRRPPSGPGGGGAAGGRTARPAAAADRPARKATPPAPATSRAPGLATTRGAPPAGRPAVSSAQLRIEARARRRRLVRAAYVLLVLGFLGGVVWLVLASPWLRVREIRVEGLNRLDRAAVLDAARPQVGRPLALADPAAVAATLRDERVVAAVAVRRSWPAALTVEVVERTPVAAVRGPGGLTLVDVDGVVLGVERTPPPGVPVVDVDLARSPQGSVQAVVAVLDALPPWLTPRVRASGAGSPDSVWLRLDGGARVVWGGADRADVKAAVLQRLLPVPAKEYDVSAPGAPALRGTERTRARTKRTTRLPTRTAGTAAAAARPTVSGTPRRGVGRTSAAAPRTERAGTPSRTGRPTTRT